MRFHRLAFALAPLALAAASAHAAPFTSPTAQFTCGGIGQLEQQQFKEAAPRHDALLTFALPSGAYLADVDVQVTSPRGKVVAQGVCDGPLMLLDVPAPGRYHITAMQHGESVSRTVSLGNASRRVHFTLPES